MFIFSLLLSFSHSHLSLWFKNYSIWWWKAIKVMTCWSKLDRRWRWDKYKISLLWFLAWVDLIYWKFVLDLSNIMVKKKGSHEPVFNPFSILFCVLKVVFIMEREVDYRCLMEITSDVLSSIFQITSMHYPKFKINLTKRMLTVT